MCVRERITVRGTLLVVLMAIDSSSGYMVRAVPDWVDCAIRSLHGCKDPYSGDR